MRRYGRLLRIALFWSFSLFSFTALVPRVHAQVDHIVIAAGTDEDHALQAISNEQDAQKKLAMYQEFVEKFASNPAAAAAVRRPTAASRRDGRCHN